MTSMLILSSMERLQDRINSAVKSYENTSGIFISLDKPQKCTEDILRGEGIDISKFFFIDCVTAEKTRDDTLHIAPNRLNELSSVIITFIKEVGGSKVLIIDSLFILLIYNRSEEFEKFIKRITEYASENNVSVVAFSPKTKGEELLNKIFNFFDEVEER